MKLFNRTISRDRATYYCFLLTDTFLVRKDEETAGNAELGQDALARAAIVRISPVRTVPPPTWPTRSRFLKFWVKSPEQSNNSPNDRRRA